MIYWIRGCGKMKKSLRDAEIVSMLEIALLPVFLYTYTPNKLIFWILIISFDSFALKKLDVEGLLPMMTSKEEMKKGRLLQFLEISYIACLGVIAFKNLELAGYLLVNDIVISFLAVYLYLKKKQ